jgi:hypothetical protein
MENNMNQETALSIVENMNMTKINDSMAKISQFQKIVQSTLVEGHDFGQAFYGSTKPSLLKPGAEKILMLLGLSSEYEIIEKIQNYEEGFFAYTVRCVLTRSGQTITQGLGHCNSKEKKYDSDKQDKYMLGNTCLKMAKKRAQVDATLTVSSLSDIFTQDVEDMAQFENDERVETMNSSDARNLKINFGKHKGKTLGQISKEDKGYLKYLSDKAKDPAVQKAAGMLFNISKSEFNPSNDNKEELAEDLANQMGMKDADDEEIPF